MTDTSLTITPEMTMEEILTVAPAAQRALFQRYHVGGCSACGFQPSDTLAQVAKDHNILDMKDVINTIIRAETLDRERQIQPDEVRALLTSGTDFSFIDVRVPDERTAPAADGSEALDYDASDKYMSLPKERRLVFICANGDRSLDVASYFMGHGFTNVYSVRGGLESWHGASA
ncbi:putative adenylyltransferase/sulfurtransferase MoeZ [Planctomycetes bacterium Poly30]|uniref:Putative adenylyltransferase/sulfurtransferase MoeZ n=1 Tax=Saltatorellus ferox TaxID=2528018 RepID=A0A518EYB2_9BACT|nr:putative adenylyltransferase/sulfurtransferase MoeZ [Planctomycetes bacterium Poly30]